MHNQRLSRFLRFVVKRYLEGREDEVKESVIGVEARAERTASTTLISTADLQEFVVHLRERGNRPVTCNTWIRALVTYRPKTFEH